jgi:hypothetical protein
MLAGAGQQGELDPRIRIRAPLRCDGIGRLDCAEDVHSGGRLAVRWLPLEANGDAAARACQKLPLHPTLPRILQTGQVGGSAFVAMDFPDGQLMSTMVGVGERLEVEQVIRIAAQLSDALATVHEQGVVHGELSPDSVLVVPGTRAYLWDMPLVIANRLTDRRGENRLMQNLTKTGPYLSPERARGEGSSQAADVFSLGVVLCVASGAPLPTASTTLGVVHQVAVGEWLPRVPAMLPDPWRSIVQRMVSVLPSARPTAREVARAFAEAPQPNSLPTVPEFPAVRLPPELLAAAAEASPARPSMTLEAPVVDVVRIPTGELDGVVVLPASAPAAAAPVVAPSVRVSENVSVSPELAQAALEMTADEERKPARSPMFWAAMATAALVLLVVTGVVFASSANKAVAHKPAVVAPARVSAPSVARTEPEDDLAPLTKLPARPARSTPTRQARGSAAKLSEAAASEGKATATATPAPTATAEPERDFSFLDGAEAPSAELKRPTY